ncbi:serine/threonine-protein kinase [Actinoplanes subglobosus]|uniref:non-specific serine/threonine protein kinase n=1 Tax=Actinoplanes subglobosus TaxID=1547892 RepID=A0ABV8J5W7_9ACTN
MARRVLSDRYELREPLGRGGMAEVWQGFDRRLRRDVAVKVLLRGGPARFEREARTIAALSHPNIVAVHDVGTDDDVRYLVMELVDGHSLAERLRTGPMTVTEAVRTAIGVCAALEAAAAAGIVHRDVKPANILLDPGGGVKVCDFGIARLAGGVGGSTRMVGTSRYMAPEQVTGSTVDARTDLYGLGCVLHEMLAGRPPFHGDDEDRVVWQHLERAPEPVSAVRPDVPPDLDRLVSALLAKYPADRPDTPADVRAALESLDTAAPAGFRRWPVIITVALSVVVFSVASSAPPSSAPPPPPVTAQPGPRAVPTASATPERRPTDPLTAVRTVIDTLPDKDARKLRRKLADLDSGRGGANRLAVKTAALRADFDDLHRDGTITDAGYATLLTGLEQIAD